MSKQKLVNLICFKYGLSVQQADRFVDDCFSKGYTWLDVVRRIEFESKLHRYATAF